MKVSRIYDARSLDTNFYETIDFFIFGTVTDEERNRRFSELWGISTKPPSFHLDYDLETEAYSLIPTSFGSIPSEAELRDAKKDITVHFRNNLREIGVKDKNLLVDITGISQPAIFYMLKVLYEDIRPARAFLTYTEPFRYKAKEWPTSEDVFELTERFIGLKALPGFIRKPARNKTLIVILLIGFEGKRAKYVCDVLEAKSDCIRVVMGFPGFRPGWQYLAYGSNQSMFEHFQAHRFIELAAGNNPFETYNALEEIRMNEIRSKTEFELAVAPVGTKPHSVGAALFTLHHAETSRLIYDFPVKARRYRSEGYGTTWIYNLTELINADDTKS